MNTRPGSSLCIEHLHFSQAIGLLMPALQMLGCHSQPCHSFTDNKDLSKHLKYDITHMWPRGTHGMIIQ